MTGKKADEKRGQKTEGYATWEWMWQPDSRTEMLVCKHEIDLKSLAHFHCFVFAVWFSVRPEYEAKILTRGEGLNIFSWTRHISSNLTCRSEANFYLSLFLWGLKREPKNIWFSNCGPLSSIFQGSFIRKQNGALIDITICVSENDRRMMESESRLPFIFFWQLFLMVGDREGRGWEGELQEETWSH